MINTFDSTLYHLINQTLTGEVLDQIMVSFSEKKFWIPMYCVVIWFMVKEHGKKSLLMLLCIGLAIFASDRISSGLMKPGFKRVRPCHIEELTPRLPEGISCSDSYGMASSHAANHFAIAVLMIAFYGTKKAKRLNAFFWLFWAASIAYSRVYCGVHYPTDVIVGAALGALMGYLAYRLYLKAETKIKLK